MPYFVYLLRCADSTLYCGITNDLAGRVATHNTSPRGARYTRSRRPVTLVYSKTVKTKGAALRREIEIKKLSRTDKLKVIASAKRAKA